jgi:hypothetical protein
MSELVTHYVPYIDLRNAIPWTKADIESCTELGQELPVKAWPVTYVNRDSGDKIELLTAVFDMHHAVYDYVDLVFTFEPYSNDRSQFTRILFTRFCFEDGEPTFYVTGGEGRYSFTEYENTFKEYLVPCVEMEERWSTDDIIRNIEYFAKYTDGYVSSVPTVSVDRFERLYESSE